MQLIYAYINNYKYIKNKEFHFDSNYKIGYNPILKELSIETKKLFLLISGVSTFHPSQPL